MIENPPMFYDGQPLSWADLEILRRNALALDAITRRGRGFWLDQVAHEFWRFDANPQPVTRGGFRFRSGMTTLTLHVRVALSSPHTLRVFLNDALAHQQALQDQINVINVSIDNRGFQDGDIVALRVDTTHGGANVRILCFDAYAHPAPQPSFAYPGVPTFGAISAANLTQLANAQRWIIQRAAAVDEPLPTAIHDQGGLWWAPTDHELFSGGVARSGELRRLLLPVTYHSAPAGPGPADERLRLFVSSGFAATLVAETPPLQRGVWATHTFDVDLSGYPDNTPLRVEVRHVVLQGTNGEPGERGTRFWINPWTVEPVNDAAAPTIAASAAKETLTFAGLQARLNAIAQATQAAYQRIVNRSDRWNRVRVFRGNPRIDDFQRWYFRDNYPAFGRRRNDLLIVRGRNALIGWGGGVKWEPNAEGRAIRITHRFQEDLIGEGVETRIVSFDEIGVPPGATYVVTGDDLIYVAEAMAI